MIFTFNNSEGVIWGSRGLSKGAELKDGKTCKRRMLAEVSGYRVESCSCGLFHVCVGPITVRMEPSAFLTFAGVVEDAVDMMGVPSSEVALNNSRILDVLVPTVAES